MFLPFIGLEISIVMIFYEYVFTNIHLHSLDLQVPLWTYLLQIPFIHSAYGIDRYFDVIQNDTDNNELIRYINKNSNYVQSTICTSILFCSGALAYDEHTRIFLPLYLLSIFNYKKIKQIFPIIKPIFISLLLITSAIIYPCVITESNYSIIKDFNSIIPPLANMYSASNAIDIIDYNVDKINNIYTLPVLYGNNTAIIASIVASSISSIAHINNINFGINPVDYLFEAQNVFSAISLINNKPKKDYRKKDDKNNKMSLSTNLKIPIKNRLYKNYISIFIPKLIPRLTSRMLLR